MRPSDVMPQRIQSSEEERVPFGSLKVVAIIAACAVCDLLALLTVYLVR